MTPSIDVSLGRGAAHAGAGRRRGGRLALAASRPRSATSRRGRAGVRAADRDRLRDQDDLRAGQICSSWSLLIAVMVVFGALTARHRAQPGARTRSGRCSARWRSRARRRWCWSSRSGSSSPKPRFLVPVGGMVVGNAMTAAAVALNRLGDEVRASRGTDRGDAGARRDRHSGDAADRPPLAALGDDPPDRLDQDDRADLLPGHDGRHAARRRRADRRRAAPADPALHAAGQRRARRADGDTGSPTATSSRRRTSCASQRWL